MRISFESYLACKSRITYDLSELSTYGRYVLLFYQVPKGQEFEKTVSFRRRLSLGPVRFDSFIVKARLEMSSEYTSVLSRVDGRRGEESDDSFVPESVSQSSCTVSSSSLPRSGDVVSSPSVGGASDRSTTVRRLFWVVMVKFDTLVSGTERFSLSQEGYPFCLVKRDLNYPGPEWLEKWQEWMQNVSIPMSQNGYPVRVGGVGKAPVSCGRGQVSHTRGKGGKSGVTSKRSQYFGGVRKEVLPKRVSPIPGAELSSDGSEMEYRSRTRQAGSTGDLRQQMLEHRVFQLEDRVRSLENLLMRNSK